MPVSRWKTHLKPSPKLILDAAISDAGERFSWPAFYLGEMAKALIDDVNEALLESRTAP